MVTIREWLTNSRSLIRWTADENMIRNGLANDHRESRQHLSRALQNGENLQRDAALVRAKSTTQSKRTRRTKPEQTSTRPSQNAQKFFFFWNRHSIWGSAANWRRARFEGNPVMNSHCCTWQNASLKEPDEDTERYPWRMPTPVGSEPVPTPVSAGPIALWRAAMITKYDLMMIEFDRDGKNWTITQRSKHHSVTRMILRDRPQSVKFMFIVTDPPNVSTRKVINISREFTEITALSYGARAS